MSIAREQLEDWKKKHGNVFELKAEDGKVCYLKPPSRAIVSMAMSKARTNPLGIIEVILENCWLGGDEVIKNAKHAGYLVGFSEHVDAIMDAKKAELKKL